MLNEPGVFPPAGEDAAQGRPTIVNRIRRGSVPQREPSRALIGLKGVVRLPFCTLPRAAFSLIELMVVVAIVGLLIAILMPLARNVQLVAKQMKCQNQQRQVGMYALTYVAENDGVFFHGNNIFTFSSDDEFKRLVLCPDGNRKYSATSNQTTMGFNGAFLGGCISSGALARPAVLSEIRSPASTVLIGDSSGTTYLEYFACGSAIKPWHRRGYYANVLAVDGHVEAFWTRTAYDNTDLYRLVSQGGLGDALTNGPFRGYTWHDRM
jgi:prepilin-type N-terminal cleavage/methylation domain-containing protein/prepilin-type processing-associated H-X9-DG protein